MPVITSTDNPVVKAARKLATAHGRARTYRPAPASATAAGEFLVEGPAVVAEAVGSLRRLFVTEVAAVQHQGLVDDARRSGAEVLLVSAAVIESVATTVTPQGVVGVAMLPARRLDDVLATATFVVICHEVRDPGNLGAVIRTADAAGADAVVLTPASVDPRNPKAVRASAGSLFHLPVVEGPVWHALAEACAQSRLRLLGTDPGGRLRHSDADLAGSVALLFGGEAAGLPAEVVRSCDDSLRVEMSTGDRAGYGGAAQSLNLAATVAVVAFEVARQRQEAEKSA